MAELHIANGDCTAAILQRHIPAESVFSWPEIIMEGPPPFNSLDAFHARSLRIDFISSYFNLPPAQVYTKLAPLHELPQRAAKASKVYLWFDDDYFCQSNLLYLFWLIKSSFTPLHLVAVPRYGLNKSSDLSLLKNEARELSSEFLTHAHQVWVAYTSSTPEPLSSFLEDPTWGSFVRLHLQRLPWKKDGLSRVQRDLLMSISEVPQSFVETFRQYVEQSNQEYGLGDLQAWKEIERLASFDCPPISFQGEERQIALTHHGREIIRGNASHIGRSPSWVGGLYLIPGSRNSWQWCSDTERVVQE